MQQHSNVKHGFMQIVAGGTAGFTEVILLFPLDVVKTRFQIQRGADDPQRYNSLRDCFRTMYRNEGLFSFYKGILPPVLAEIPKRATKFFTFEQYKSVLQSNISSVPVTLTLAGLLSGLTEGIVINPFEVVKVKLQAERIDFAQQKSTFVTAREILKTDGLGLRGLNKGLTATLGRHGVFNMVYFGFYHNAKRLAPSFDNQYAEFLRRFSLGFFAGTFASCVNIPFDVAKSRIQGPQPVEKQIKYRACFATILTVYKEEGILALYKGLVPKIMRLGPGGAIMMVVFEVVYKTNDLRVVNVTHASTIISEHIENIVQRTVAFDIDLHDQSQSRQNVYISETNRFTEVPKSIPPQVIVRNAMQTVTITNAHHK